MKIINLPSVTVEPFDPQTVLSKIMYAYLVCTKRTPPADVPAFIEARIRQGHVSPLEHVNVTVFFKTDRGVSHQLVRHRLMSVSQESTRFCRYDEIEALLPPFENPADRIIWKNAMETCEDSYLSLLKRGVSTNISRSVLPNSTATRIMVTANLREWRHILTLRTSSEAHPQIRQIMIPLLVYFKDKLPCVFADIPIPDEYYKKPYQFPEVQEVLQMEDEIEEEPQGDLANDPDVYAETKKHVVRRVLSREEENVAGIIECQEQDHALLEEYA